VGAPLKSGRHIPSCPLRHCARRQVLSRGPGRLFSETSLCIMSAFRYRERCALIASRRAVSSFVMADWTEFVDCGLWVNSLSARPAGAIAKHPNIRLLDWPLSNSYKLTAGSPNVCVASYCWLGLDFWLFDLNLFRLPPSSPGRFLFDEVSEMLRFCIRPAGSWKRQRYRPYKLCLVYWHR